MSNIQAYLIMFFTGGFLYCAIEILARGYSHISMLIAGGTCFLLVGVIESVLGHSASILSQMFFCGIMITTVELLFGIVVNRQLHLNVWDYSGEQYNFQGQICLLYSNLWFLLSCPVIFLHDYMEFLFAECTTSPLPNFLTPSIINKYHRPFSFLIIYRRNRLPFLQHDSRFLFPVLFLFY